jgi:hypothetical protein
MSIIRFFDAISGGRRMINLTYVSTAVLKGSRIKLYKANQRESIAGNFLFFGGGGTEVEEIQCANETEAQKEFESICNSLKQYYDKQ